MNPLDPAAAAIGAGVADAIRKLAPEVIPALKQVAMGQTVTLAIQIKEFTVPVEITIKDGAS